MALTLHPLPKASNVKGNSSMVSGLTSGGRRFKLIQPVGPHQLYKITTEGKMANGKLYTRTLKTFSVGTDLSWVNNDLKAQNGFPVLEAALGLVPGAGTAYGLINTAIGQMSGQQHASVLARVHDKVVATEQIGKYNGRPTHVLMLFIVDPFRKTTKGTGMAWLIHEERREVDIS